jgi:hypothetical protein
VATGLLSIVNPAPLIVVPLALLLVALPPVRPAWIVLGAMLLVPVWLTPATGVTDFERGYALVLAAWFLAASVAVPKQTFLTRALIAVLAAGTTCAVFYVLEPGAFAQLDASLRLRVMSGVESLLALAEGNERIGLVEPALREVADVQTRIYPALLALASLAALGVAWWVFRRLTANDGHALGPLSRFRFTDALVWLLIAGVLLVLLPLDDAAGRAGANLLAFMGVLYSVRGLAVLVVLSGGLPGPIGIALGMVLIVLLYPLVMAATFVVGLSDTWVEFRKRREAEPPAA